MHTQAETRFLATIVGGHPDVLPLPVLFSMKQQEWQRYQKQAKHTLASAQRDYEAQDFDWACFRPIKRQNCF